VLDLISRKKSQLQELPPRSLGGKIFLPQSECKPWPHREHRLLHRKDAVFHTLHIELVLAFTGRKKFSTCRKIGDLRGSLDNHGFIRMLGTNDAVSILPKIPGLPRLASSTEKQSPILPQTPNDHRVRRAIRLYRCNPVIVRFLQPLFRPAPRQKALRSFRQAISRRVRTARLGRLRMFLHNFIAHRSTRSWKARRQFSRKARKSNPVQANRPERVLGEGGNSTVYVRLLGVFYSESQHVFP
jgi:hypothetical protein